LPISPIHEPFLRSLMSFPRRRESSLSWLFWSPASAAVTTRGPYYRENAPVGAPSAGGHKARPCIFMLLQRTCPPLVHSCGSGSSSVDILRISSCNTQPLSP
jgi:hypothetical protein